MFSPNEMAVIILCVALIFFMILMYSIISNAIDGRDRKQKRLEKRTSDLDVNRSNRDIIK